jgi:glycosyltransferase involved in cell wall biosynthesis
VRILQIYKDYAPVLGGIENHIRWLSEGLVRRGHQVTVLTSGKTRQTEVSWLNGVRVIYAGRLATLSSASISLALPLRLAAERADLAHLHMPDPVGDVALSLVQPRLPFVITYHSDIVRQRRLRAVYAPILRRTLRRAERIIATSPAYIQSSRFLRPLAERCTVIPLGIAVDRFLACDPQPVAAIRARWPEPLLLFVGRLRYYKGIDQLVRALAWLPARALIVGSEATVGRIELERLARECGVADRLSFVGRQDDADLPAFFHAADVFVLPSVERSEAFGIVQLEAQAAGLPIVCTELGTGTSFVTRHGETGFVVPPRDPQALARAIRVLLENPELAQRFGAAGRQRVLSEFSREQMIERVERLYLELGGISRVRS